MTYTTTMTSKGQITLPAQLRKHLGLRKGDKVEVSLHGDAMMIKAQIGWDDFFSDELDMGAKARGLIASGKKRKLTTNDDISEAIRAVRKTEYAKS